MQQAEKPSFYEYEMLWYKVMNRSYFVDCKELKWKQVNIGHIINDVVIENAAIENKDNPFINPIKGMCMTLNHITNRAHGGLPPVQLAVLEKL
ncbi:MAG: hypothetical protein IPO21_09975 [Bacteroidales bacterium]|nr:hypothetical protein [Bacteroidales bacterium]